MNTLFLVILLNVDVSWAVAGNNKNNSLNRVNSSIALNFYN